MTQYIVVNGFPGSGKTTFEDMCIELIQYTYYENAIRVSTIDPIKDAARRLGWTGEKTPETRKFLSDLKIMANQLFDTSMKYVEGQVDFEESLQCLPSEKLFVFVDVREPDDIHRFVTEHNALTVFIKRKDHDIVSNSGDANVENYPYDIEIDNNGTLDDLKESAEGLVGWLMEDYNEEGDCE